MLELHNWGKLNFLKGKDAYSQLISPVWCKDKEGKVNSKEFFKGENDVK